jgi:Protein of unknown function (DUF1203)
MCAFRCIPIDSGTADVLRSETHDALGNLIRRVSGNVAGMPCRHCLSEAIGGETVLLASYALPRPKGLYWTPSPIFVHAHSCAGYVQVDHIPPIVSNRLVSLRSYDVDHQCIYDLGVVIDGHEAETPLRHALDDTRTAFVNIHTAKPGCLLCTVERC